MKSSLILWAFIALMGSTKPDSGNVTVNLHGIKSQEGQIVFMLFSQEEGFPREPGKAFKKGVIKEFSDNAQYIFKDIPYGAYAVSVFQDKDKDGEIKSNFMGMPKEPVGASNMTKLGKPSFKKCVFQLNSKNKVLNMKFILD